MLELNKDNFENEVKESDKPVIVDFWAEWCGPCKQLAPVYDAVSKEYGDKLKFAKVDAQQNQELSVENGVSGIPCMIVFSGGEEKGRIVGFRDEDGLKDEIDKILSS